MNSGSTIWSGSHPAERSIRCWSKLMAGLCLVAAPLLVAGAVYQAVIMTPASIAQALALPVVSIALASRVAVIVMMMIPAIALAAGLLRLYSAFLSLGSGGPFSIVAVRGLRDFAALAVASTLLALISAPLIGLVLTIGSERGVSLPLRFGSDNLTVLLVGGITWMFARMLAMAISLREQNEQLAQENAAFV